MDEIEVILHTEILLYWQPARPVQGTKRLFALQVAATVVSSICPEKHRGLIRSNPVYYGI